MASVVRDPAAWSVLIAVLALILSQLPPVRQILRGHGLRVALPNQFFLWHTMGNLQVDIVVGIRNTGGRDAFISRIDCYIVDDQGRKWKLPAQAYLQSATQVGTTPPEIALSGLTISPDDFWSETVRCYEDVSDHEQRELEAIYDKFYVAGVSDAAPQADGSLPEVAASVADEAAAYFERRFRLRQGRYRLLVTAISQSRRGSDYVAGIVGCEFNLYASNIQKLRAIVDQYRYGFGVTRAAPNPALGSTLARVKPLSAEDVRAAYRTATVADHSE